MTPLARAIPRARLFLLLGAFLGGLLAGPPPASAQQDSDSSPDTTEAVRVFLDCQTYQCDESYIRREVRFVNYVRDRTDADVHVLVTAQQTGGGGSLFTLNFIGKRRFDGLSDTLTYASSETDTEQEVRRGLVRVFKAGLMRYVARTDGLSQVQIRQTDVEAEAQRTTPEEDPWNYWVYEIGTEGNFQGESQQREYSVEGNLSANRTTRTWKIDLSGEAEYQFESFEVEQGQTITSTQRNYRFSALVVRSLSDHWSLGGFAEARRSTFSNYDLAANVAPALEYNVYPYSVSTTRQFRILYRIQPTYFNYADSTIFNRLQETRVRQSLQATLELNRPWGSVETSLTASHFFFDFSKNRLELDVNLDLRIVRGLSLNVFGNVSLIRDQLNLPKGEASREDVLLQRRELATNYRYFTGLGLSYTFGSIYNNIVNPRFGGGGGGGRDGPGGP
ncbi:MAG: DUF481 domain-containing protein [Salinibacter sp.]